MADGIVSITTALIGAVGAVAAAVAAATITARAKQSDERKSQKIDSPPVIAPAAGSSSLTAKPRPVRVAQIVAGLLVLVSIVLLWVAIAGEWYTASWWLTVILCLTFFSLVWIINSLIELIEPTLPKEPSGR